MRCISRLLHKSGKIGEMASQMHGQGDDVGRRNMARQSGRALHYSFRIIAALAVLDIDCDHRIDSQCDFPTISTLRPGIKNSLTKNTPAFRQITVAHI